jgi:2-methylcitrate dehydratase PrpD
MAGMGEYQKYVRTTFIFVTIIENMSGQINTNLSLLQVLAQRLIEPVTVKDRARAVLHVLDWLGNACAGRTHDAAAKFALPAAVGGVATIGANRADWWYALQVNAALGNLLEMDDLHRTSILHPGPVIIPAAIAVAELVNASGEALLDAIVRGYEATIRIGAALGTSHYQYFHNTSTCGTFGAAAAAAALLKISPDALVHALANAGSRTGGLWQMRHTSCETKSLHNVMAAQTGVQSALLAAQGIRGPESLLEGVQGLFAAMSHSADAQQVVADLAHDWQIHDVSFKPWPACRHAHPTIDAALAVLASLPLALAQPLRLEDVERIEVSTYRSAIDFCNKPTPNTELEAKFSLQHAIAVCMARGAPQMTDFAVDNLAAAEIAEWRKKVNVSENVELSAAFPQHYRASITLAMRDGRQFQHSQQDAKGDPEMPMSVAEIRTKAARLMHEANVNDVDMLIDHTMQLDSSLPVSAWTKRWPQGKHAQDWKYTPIAMATQQCLQEAQ